jgi:hypothetical protein
MRENIKAKIEGTFVGRISSRDKVGNVFVKTGDADRYGGGGDFIILVVILVGRIAGRDKVCGRVALNEVTILLQNVYGDVEGYVIGCHVGIFDNIVSDTEEDILVGCVAV